MAATAAGSAIRRNNAARQGSYVRRRQVRILIGPPVPCGGGVTRRRLTAEDPGEWFHCGVCHTDGPYTGEDYCPACTDMV